MKLLLSALLLVSLPARAILVDAPSTGLHFNTSKIATVYGEINDAQVDAYEEQVAATESLPGPRVVLIDSPGGYVYAGNALISIMEHERASGVTQVCIVTGGASSMAFNLLTHCDMRLAVPQARMLVHKVEGWGAQRHTARNMREAADEIDRIDEPFRQANSKAMHLTLRQYDRYADAETDWSAEKLLKLRYLDGIIKLK